MEDRLRHYARLLSEPVNRAVSLSELPSPTIPEQYVTAGNALQDHSRREQLERVEGERR